MIWASLQWVPTNHLMKVGPRTVKEFRLKDYGKTENRGY